MHVQICCFARSTYCFFDVLVVVAVMASYSQLFAMKLEITCQ